MAVVRCAFGVGSERVGRTTKFDEDRKLELTVIAHARHSRTDYDHLLGEGWEQIDARDHVREQVAEIVEFWSEA